MNRNSKLAQNAKVDSLNCALFNEFNFNPHVQNFYFLKFRFPMAPKSTSCTAFNVEGEVPTQFSQRKLDFSVRVSRRMSILTQRYRTPGRAPSYRLSSSSYSRLNLVFADLA